MRWARLSIMTNFNFKGLCIFGGLVYRYLNWLEITPRLLYLLIGAKSLIDKIIKRALNCG